MTSANKHIDRIHRSYRYKKNTIGSFESKNYQKNGSRTAKATRIPIIEKLLSLLGIRKQDRG